MSSTWSDDLVPRGRGTLPPLPTPPVPGPTAPWMAGGSGEGGVRRSPGLIAAVILVLVVFLALPIAALGRNAHSFWPAQWDPHLAPITQRDQQLRGLTYVHPVPVVFLTDKAFVKRLNANNAPSASDRADIAREAGTFRSLGFIGGKVDLQKAVTAASDAGVLAYYDDGLKEIVVRGTTLDVSHRATLAHELTHVLQDQHFNLPLIEQRASKDDEQSGDSGDAMTALIEGDANHVEDEYVQSLPLAQRKEYDREQRQEGATVDKGLATVPPFVSFIFGSPYEFGPPAIRVLAASGGNAAVNAALSGPTPTSALFVQTGLVATAPPGIAEPALASGEKADGPPESFGAFELYLALSMKVDPQQALAAADVVLGGRARGLKEGSRYCYRATLETRDPTAAKFVAGVARRWAPTMTRGSVSQKGTSVTINACDPGPGAPAPPKSKLVAADRLLALRAALTAGVAEDHAGAGVARCAARLIVRDPGVLPLLAKNALTDAEKATVRTYARAAGAECRDSPDAGLQ